MYFYEDIGIKVLLGKSLKNVNCDGDEVIFTTVEGEKYRLFHGQD